MKYISSLLPKINSLQVIAKFFCSSPLKSILKIMAIIFCMRNANLAYSEELFLANIQQFIPNTGGESNFISLQTPYTIGNFHPAISFYTNYSYRPLRLNIDGLDDQTDIITHQIQSDLLLAMGIGSRLQMGVGVPYTFYQYSSDNLLDIPRQSFGDLRFQAKWLAYHYQDKFALGFAGTLHVPVSYEQSFQTRREISIEPTVSSSFSLNQYFQTTLNVSYLIQKNTNIFDLKIGNEITYALGFQVFPIPDKFALITEFKGRAPLDNDVSLTTSGSPFEWAMHAKWWISPRNSISIGAGTGLTPGYGAPLLRTYIGYSYTGVSGVGRDSDKDGILNSMDKCPRAAEDFDRFGDSDGCPDMDNDGDDIPDWTDKCPDKKEDIDTFEDADGCPDNDNDNDGIMDTLDKCPLVKESINDIEDSDGCPETDSDNDGVADVIDVCPQISGKLNGISNTNGCPNLDQDGDGIQDDVDECPTKMETLNGYKDFDGCPEIDSDSDNIPDAVDQCQHKPETINGYEDVDGCPETDSDNDGIADVMDNCPRQLEDGKGINNKDGCPQQDIDGDGIVDDKDKCPNYPETVNGFEDADGCPDTKNNEISKNNNNDIDVKSDGTPALAQSSQISQSKAINTTDSNSSNEKDEILTALEQIAKQDSPKTHIVEPSKAMIPIVMLFDFDQWKINSKNKKMLSKIAKYLQDHPEYKARIRGPNDLIYRSTYQVTLFKKRAKEVQSFLKDKDVLDEQIEKIKLPKRDKKAKADKSKQIKTEGRKVKVFIIDSKGLINDDLAIELGMSPVVPQIILQDSQKNQSVDFSSNVEK